MVRGANLGATVFLTAFLVFISGGNINANHDHTLQQVNRLTDIRTSLADYLNVVDLDLAKADLESLEKSVYEVYTRAEQFSKEISDAIEETTDPQQLIILAYIQLGVKSSVEVATSLRLIISDSWLLSLEANPHSENASSIRDRIRLRRENVKTQLGVITLIELMVIELIGREFISPR